MAGKYTYRLTSEGFTEFERQLSALGDTGKAAFDKIKATMPEFADAAEKARQKAEEHRKKLEESAKGADNFSAALSGANRVLGAFGVALSVGAAVKFATDLLKSTAAIADQAQVIGVGIEALQAYRAAAIRTGEDIGNADTALQRFTRTIGEANEGTGKQREAFQDLRLTAQDIAGGTEAALPKVAGALLNIRDASERARLETILFGKSGQAVETMLQDWADPEIIQKMKGLGLVIDEDLVKRADAADAAWKEFWTRFKIGVVEGAGVLATFMARGPGRGDVVIGGTDVTLPFANAATTAMGLANSLPFAGKDTLAIAGVGSRAAAPWVDEAALKQQKEDIAGFWRDVATVENRAYERSVKEAADYWKDVDRLRAEDEKALDDFHARREKTEEYHLERVLKEAEDHWKAVDRLRNEDGEKFDRDVEREKQKVKDYWTGVTDDMRLSFKDFWMEFAETGELNFETLLGRMKAMWASVLFDMARQGQLFGQNGTFGGGALGAKPGQVGWVGGGLSAAALIAGAFQDPNGNTRISGGLSGAASGAMMGSMILPGIGTAVGAIIGGIAGLIGGSDKPSNYRATATFMPGMSNFGLSGDKPNENTLGMAAQAAEAIKAEISALRSFGVDFTKQLANIWIGQRDASTYQLVGGQRISVGSVANPADLARDTLNALLAGALSSDPTTAAVLKSGAPDLLQALQFAQGVSESLKQITDPLQYAIDLWKREAEARLEMAKASGVDLDVVRQLNNELRGQIMEQYYGPTQSSLTGFIQSLQFGPNSTLSPQAQYTAAFSAYDAARTAALGNATPETIAAFVGQANTFLPIARGYWASSQPYGALEQGALNTAQQLQGIISSMMSGQDSTVTAITSGAAATVEAVNGVSERIDRMNERMDRLAGTIEAMMARV